MQPQKPKRIHVILLIALIAAEAALAMLYAASRTSGSMLLSELYVAAILICAILLAYLLLTRMGPVLLFHSAKSKLTALTAAEDECTSIEPEGLAQRITEALKKDGFAVSQTLVPQNGRDALHVTVASPKRSACFSTGCTGMSYSPKISAKRATSIRWSSTCKASLTRRGFPTTRGRGAASQRWWC